MLLGKSLIKILFEWELVNCKKYQMESFYDRLHPTGEFRKITILKDI